MSFVPSSIIQLSYKPNEFQPGRLRLVSTAESRLGEAHAVWAVQNDGQIHNVVICFRIYWNDLCVFVLNFLVISSSTTYFFISVTTFPFPSLIRSFRLSEPRFSPYRSVKRGFTVSTGKSKIYLHVCYRKL